jgi:hypothetical protein
MTVKFTGPYGPNPMNREKAKKIALRGIIKLFVILTLVSIVFVLMPGSGITKPLEAILLLTGASAGLAVIIGAIMFLVMVYDINIGL